MGDSAEVYPGMPRRLRPRLEVFAPEVDREEVAAPAWRAWCRRLHLAPILAAMLLAALAGQRGCEAAAAPSPAKRAARLAPAIVGVWDARWIGDDLADEADGTDETDCWGGEMYFGGAGDYHHLLPDEQGRAIRFVGVWRIEAGVLVVQEARQAADGSVDWSKFTAWRVKLERSQDGWRGSVTGGYGPARWGLRPLARVTGPGL